MFTLSTFVKTKIQCNYKNVNPGGLKNDISLSRADNDLYLRVRSSLNVIYKTLNIKIPGRTYGLCTARGNPFI